MYVRAVVLDLGRFLAVFAFNDVAGVAFENGARSFRAEKTLFLQCFGVLGGNELSQQALQIFGVVFRAQCENEPLENPFAVFKVILCCQASSGCEARISRESVKIRGTAGKNGVFVVRIPKNSIIPKTGVQKMFQDHLLGSGCQKCHVFCRRASIFEKYTFLLLQNLTNFTETIENIVPKWRWQKTVVALEQAILTVAATEIFLSPLHLITHSHSTTQEELFCSSCAFGFLKTCFSQSEFFIRILLCLIYP